MKPSWILLVWLWKCLIPCWRDSSSHGGATSLSNISLSQPTEDSFAFVTILSKLHDLQSFLQDLKPCLDVACVCMHAQSFSRVRLFATLWTVARQPPLSIGFSRQEYWSGLSWPSSGDLPYPGIEQASPASPASTGEFFHWATWEALGVASLLVNESLSSVQDAMPPVETLKSQWLSCLNFWWSPTWTLKSCVYLCHNANCLCELQNKNNNSTYYYCTKLLWGRQGLAQHLTQSNHQ